MPPDLDSLKHFQLVRCHSAIKHQDLLAVGEEKSSNPNFILVTLQGTCKYLLLDTVW